MFVLGLTGSLAMGKSTVAVMFAAEGAAVFNADSVVHDLYAGVAVAPIEAVFPGVAANGVIDRALLGKRVVGDKPALAKLEAIVHPLVHAAENAFRARAEREGRRVAVLDIPLLLETGGEKRVDAVMVVTTTADIQRERILRRDGMTKDRAAALLARQMPDAEKRKRAHFIIDTSGEYAATRKQVDDVMRAIAGMAAGR
jgi:dephospho-CoA kinase